MRVNGFITIQENRDSIDICRPSTRGEEGVVIWLCDVVGIRLETNKQLLDLGMRIQSIINQIDRENKENDAILN